MKPKWILLVEDNPDDELLMLRALKKNAVLNEVRVARDGVEALDHLLTAWDEDAAPQELPAVVLLDLKLPKVDGLEVLRRLRAETHTRLLPVVVLTSSHEREDVLAAYTLGANSYVRKPVDFTEFTQIISVLGVYWLSINELPC